MNPEEKTTSPFAKIALRMAWFSLFLAVAPFVVGTVLRATRMHSAGRALAVVWGTFIANTFVLAPVTALVAIAGFVHVLRNRFSVCGVGPLAAALCIIVVSAGGGLLLLRAIFEASM